MFKVKLVHKGFVRELFYREAISYDAILKYLDMFEWPQGKWKISEVEE
jgi:hypothetical protein